MQDELICENCGASEEDIETYYKRHVCQRCGREWFDEPECEEDTRSYY